MFASFIEYFRERRIINFAPGNFHSPIFMWGEEKIVDPNITKWNITAQPRMLDVVSSLNDEGQGYSTDFIWVKRFISL